MKHWRVSQFDNFGPCGTYDFRWWIQAKVVAVLLRGGGRYFSVRIDRLASNGEVLYD